MSAATQELPRTDPASLMADLAADATAIDAASSQLWKKVRGFEGISESALGLKVRWEAVLDAAMVGAHEAMLNEARDPGNKLPAGLKSKTAKVLEAEARIFAKRENPALWREYSEAEAEIKALSIYVRGKERSSNIRQTLLSAQKVGAFG